MSPEVTRDPQAMQDWLGSFDLVSSIYWTSRGNLLLQYQTFDAGVPDWRLLALATNGAQLFEVADAPQLLTVSPDGTSFYFVHPESETPERWLIGQLYVY